MALLAAQDAGVKLILASGRPVQGLRAIASELALSEHGGLLVAFNGAHVVDAQTDEVLYDQPIDSDTMRELIGHVRDFDVIPWITRGGELFVERSSRHVIRYRDEDLDIVGNECRMCDLVPCGVDDLLEACATLQDATAEPSTCRALAVDGRAVRRPPPPCSRPTSTELWRPSRKGRAHRVPCPSIDAWSSRSVTGKRRVHDQVRAWALPWARLTGQGGGGR
ncbi:MAG: HAD family hydrolase [Collinsella intestinalis]